MIADTLAPKVRFFVAGVAKAGTTALCQLLAQHPQIFMCPIKEPTFFAARELLSFDADSNAWIATRARDVRRWLAGETVHPPRHGLALEWRDYDALFRGVLEQRAIGEGSVSYWWAPGAPSAIREKFPDARLIVMLRNPADRLFSEYLAMRWAYPLRTFAEHIALGLERRDGGVGIEAGYYATHLERFFTHFPREQFNIHLYEDFSADPRSVCRDILAFVGVDPDHPIDVSQRINAPQLPRWPRLHAALRSSGATRALWRRLPRPWRERVRGVYSERRSREVMDSADRRVLVEHYRDEMEKTAKLIGRDLSQWLC